MFLVSVFALFNCWTSRSSSAFGLWLCLQLKCHTPNTIKLTCESQLLGLLVARFSLAVESSTTVHLQVWTNLTFLKTKLSTTETRLASSSRHVFGPDKSTMSTYWGLACLWIRANVLKNNPTVFTCTVLPSNEIQRCKLNLWATLYLSNVYMMVMVSLQERFAEWF